MTEDQEFEEEVRLMRRPKNTYHSKSSKSDDFQSDLLRDKVTRNVAGPTESRSIDENELRQRYQSGISDRTDSSPQTLTPGQQALAAALVDVTEVVLRELVVPFIKDVAAPAAKTKWHDFIERRRGRSQDSQAAAKAEPRKTSAAKRPVVDATETMQSFQDIATTDVKVPMRRSDVAKAQLQLKLAEDYAARLSWLLEHSEVTDDDLPSSLEGTMTLVLEGRTSKLNEEQLKLLADFLQPKDDSQES